jgi:hypothetical protein
MKSLRYTGGNTITATSQFGAIDLCGPLLNLALPSSAASLLMFKLNIASYFTDSNNNQSYSFQAQDSPDGVNWTNRGAAQTLGAAGTSPNNPAGSLVSSTDPSGVALVGFVLLSFTPIQRYVRLTVAIAGSTPSITLAESFLKIPGLT